MAVKRYTLQETAQKLGVSEEALLDKAQSANILPSEEADNFYFTDSQFETLSDLFQSDIDDILNSTWGGGGSIPSNDSDLLLPDSFDPTADAPASADPDPVAGLDLDDLDLDSAFSSPPATPAAQNDLADDLSDFDFIDDDITSSGPSAATGGAAMSPLAADDMKETDDPEFLNLDDDHGDADMFDLADDPLPQQAPAPVADVIPELPKAPTGPSSSVFNPGDDFFVEDSSSNAQAFLMDDEPLPGAEPTSAAPPIDSHIYSDNPMAPADGSFTDAPTMIGLPNPEDEPFDLVVNEEEEDNIPLADAVEEENLMDELDLNFDEPEDGELLDDPRAGGPAPLGAPAKGTDPLMQTVDFGGGADDEDDIPAGILEDDANLLGSLEEGSLLDPVAGSSSAFNPAGEGSIFNLEEQDGGFDLDDDAIDLVGPMSHGPSSSGINLTSPSDSGLDLANDGSEFELSLDSEDVSLNSDEEFGFADEETEAAMVADSDDSTSLDSQESFELALGEESEEDIEVDDESASEVVAIDSDLDDEEGSDDLFPSDVTRPGEDRYAGGYAGPVMVAREAPWGWWPLVCLMPTTFVLLITGMMMWESLRSTWAHQSSTSFSGAVTKQVAELGKAVGISK